MTIVGSENHYAKDNLLKCFFLSNLTDYFNELSLILGQIRSKS